LITTVAGLSGISQAVLEGTITREEAEYLTQESYQVPNPPNTSSPNSMFTSNTMPPSEV
jgi:hypothetical protein